MAQAERPAPPVYAVFVDRLHNLSRVPATAIELRLPLPVSTPWQTVGPLTFEAAPALVALDKWDRRLGLWRETTLAPRRRLTVRWACRAALHPGRVDLTGAGAPTDRRPPRAIRGLYLRDGVKYGLQTEIVRAAAEACKAGDPSYAELLGRIFDAVVDRIVYKRDPEWSTAPTVLARGTGSCSEYTFTFVALCRSLGIPARYVGGMRTVTEGPLYVDNIWHRWSEAWIDAHGWVPFDPTRSDGQGRHRRYFAAQPENVLQMCAGDGGADSLVDWHYLSWHAWTGPAKLATTRRGWTFREVPTEVAERAPGLSDDALAGRPSALREARALGHPYALPWIDELLYSASSRRVASGAFMEIGGPPAVLAVIDSIGRSGDLAGDRVIGDLLKEATGRSFRTDRQAWTEWLSTTQGRAFLRGGSAASER